VVAVTSSGRLARSNRSAKSAGAWGVQDASWFAALVPKSGAREKENGDRHFEDDDGDFVGGGRRAKEEDDPEEEEEEEAPSPGVREAKKRPEAAATRTRNRTTLRLEGLPNGLSGVVEEYRDFLLLPEKDFHPALVGAPLVVGDESLHPLPSLLYEPAWSWMGEWASSLLRDGDDDDEDEDEGVAAVLIKGKSGSRLLVDENVECISLPAVYVLSLQ
jgi:hypothetical protein